MILSCVERQNHARELVKEYDLTSVDGIVIASGDGLLYEVICSVDSVYMTHAMRCAKVLGDAKYHKTIV